MKHTIRALALTLALLPGIAAAQVPQFPQNLPANTVVGRLGLGSGPSQAIPFSALQQAISPSSSVLSSGAVCSGLASDAAANLRAFTQALATGKNVFVPFCAAGYNIGGGSITLQSGQSITCENQATVIFGQGQKVFYINSLGPQTSITNCTVQMAGAPVGSTAFRLATSPAVVNSVVLRNVKCLFAQECIGDEGVHPAAFLTIDGAYATQTLGRQFHIANSNGFVEINNIQCDFTNEVGIGLVTWGCGEFDNFIGLRMSGLSTATFTGVGTPAYSAVPAWKFSTGQALWIDTLFADTTNGDGILIDGVTFLWANALEASLNLGTGVTISNGTRANITNLICIGAVGLTGAAASKAGCDINAQSLVNISNLYQEKSTGTGVRLRGAANQINIANLIAKTNTGGGLSIEDTSNIINIANGNVGGNGGAAYSNTSSGASIFVNFLSGGTQWAVQAAPGSPPSGNGAFWFDSVDLRWHDENAAGAIGTTAVAKSAVANQFLTAMGNNGVFTSAQPACATLSNSGPACTAAAGQLPATATNDNASAGNLGQYIESVVPVGSAISLTTATPVNLTSISLTAGDWDVDAVFDYTGNTGTTTSSFAGSISTTTATHDFTNGRGYAVAGSAAAFNQVSAGQPIGLPIQPVRLSLSATTSVFAVASAVFATNTNTVYGIIRARRVR